MGLTNLPTVGGTLGPVKRDRELGGEPDPVRDLAASQWNAAASALEQVCAEVGLADGSTAGSLVARVDAPRPVIGDTLVSAYTTLPADQNTHRRISALSAAVPITVNSGVAGDRMTFHVTNADNLVSIANGTATVKFYGDVVVGDSIPDESFITLEWDTATTVLCTVRKLGGLHAPRVVLAGTDAITDADVGVPVIYAVTCTIDLDASVSVGVEVRLTSLGGTQTFSATGGASITGNGLGGFTSGDTVLASKVDSTTWLIQRISDDSVLSHPDITSGNPHNVSASDIAVPAPPTHTGATLTLADSDHGSVIRVSASSNAVAIEIPDTLTGGDAADVTGVDFGLVITDATTNAVTISTGAGLLTPVYYGQNSIGVDNTVVGILVVRGVAYVTIVEPV